MQEHLEHLDIVFNILSENRLHLNWVKSVFAKDKIDFLGFTVSTHGFKQLEEKIEAILPRADGTLCGTLSATWELSIISERTFQI